MMGHLFTKEIVLFWCLRSVGKGEIHAWSWVWGFLFIPSWYVIWLFFQNFHICLVVVLGWRLNFDWYEVSRNMVLRLVWNWYWYTGRVLATRVDTRCRPTNHANTALNTINLWHIETSEDKLRRKLWKYQCQILLSEFKYFIVWRAFIRNKMQVQIITQDLKLTTHA